MAAPPWAPSSAAVAPHLKQFLRTATGGQLENFTTETTIRLAEVDQAITSVVADVAAAVGDDVSAGWDDVPATSRLPDSVYDHAAAVVAIGAAAEAVIDRDLELSRQLQALYESRLKRLIAAAQDAADGKVTGVASRPASGSFPGPFGVARDSF